VVAGDHQTVMIAMGTTAPNDALIPMQGRLAVGESTEGVVNTRVLDLVDGGALDKKRVAVVATDPSGAAEAQDVRQLLFDADPNRKIVVAPSTATPDPRADVVILTSFDRDLVALAHKETPHPVAVYSLDDASDAALDTIRTSEGPDAARLLAEAPVFGWLSATSVQWRADKDPTKFATLCNDTYAGARTTTTTSSTLPAGPTTTAPSDVAPESVYQQVAQVCLALRTTARALYVAGTNPTVRSLTRALYRLPYIDEIANAPKARPNQVINEPVRRARHPVFLAKPQYPCTQPTAPKDAASATMCWVPVSGYEDGHPVDAPL
jgi:hypothetical protein